ncbi:MAG: lipid-A-disaccharide synthase N-terminal domain-containing protein [Planctomycetota bacterium]|nr:lipid-A-disaccharide synthase N-terminal domain-containing protein [Planctomycetota bacterium]
MWVSVGLLGQALFTGRMLVQWVASERRRRSTIPVMFWWMSLLGASMLLAYFIWRKDIVGILGQGLGWVIYIRNLALIYGGRSDSPGAGEDVDPEPALEEGAG